MQHSHQKGSPICLTGSSSQMRNRFVKVLLRWSIEFELFPYRLLI